MLRSSFSGNDDQGGENERRDADHSFDGQQTRLDCIAGGGEVASRRSSPAKPSSTPIVQPPAAPPRTWSASAVFRLPAWTRGPICPTMESPQGLAAVESPTRRLRLTSTKSGSIVSLELQTARVLTGRRRARARLVARVEPRRARDAQPREAVASGVVAAARAVALGAALPANRSVQAAEPLARRRAAWWTAAAFLAGLAR